jgi:hypothetical protein|nr:MAG TPA: hypothetical protein [Caudoviricetes sp.]
MALELTQHVSGAVLEARGDGVIDRITPDGILTREQDVTEILSQNAEERTEDRFRGFRIAPTFRRVASIPVAVVDIAKAQGLDILGNPDDMRKFLNDPANAAFRTTHEVV